jgi:hypothetical protein
MVCRNRFDPNKNVRISEKSIKPLTRCNHLRHLIKNTVPDVEKCRGNPQNV